MTTDQEKLLLEQIHADSRHFGVLFEHYYRPVFGYIFRRVGQYDLARDIAAECFLKAYLNIKHFKWRGIGLSAWLYKIATNEVNYYFRKQKFKATAMMQVLNMEAFDFNNSATWESERAELEEELKAHASFLTIQQHLKRLDIHYQEVIALRYFESKSNREIAQILGKPEGTIKSLLSRGLEKLRTLAGKDAQTVQPKQD